MWIRIRVSSWQMSVISSSLTATSEGRTPIRDWRSPGIYLAASISLSFSLLSSSWSSEIFIEWSHEYADTRNSFKANRITLYPPKGLIFILGRPISNTCYQPRYLGQPTPKHFEHDNVLNSSRKNSDIDCFSFPCFDELKTCNFSSGGVQNLSTANRRLEDILFHGKNISQSESRVTAGRLISKADPNGQSNKSTTYLVHHPCLDSC